MFLDGIKFRAIEIAAGLIKFLSPRDSKIIIKKNLMIATTNLSPNQNSIGDVGIVIQGPIKSKNDLEILLSFAGSLTETGLISDLVISTWDNCEFLDFLDKSRFKIVLNNDQYFANNLERQLHTTSKGIAALDKKCKYVIKIRSDHQISKAGLSLISSLLSSDFIKDRLIFSSMNSYLHRAFGISDMLVAGNINDMKLFWDENVREDIFDTSNTKINSKAIFRSTDIENFWYESFLNIRFAYEKGFKFSEDIWHDSLEYLRRFTLILDSELLEHCSNKIKSNLNSLSHRSIYNPQVDEEDIEISHNIWFLNFIGIPLNFNKKLDLQFKSNNLLNVTINKF